MHSRRAAIRAVTLAGLAGALALASLATGAVPFEARTLDGSRNNQRNPDWGRSNMATSSGGHGAASLLAAR